MAIVQIYTEEHTMSFFRKWGKRVEVNHTTTFRINVDELEDAGIKDSEIDRWELTVANFIMNKSVSDYSDGLFQYAVGIAKNEQIKLQEALAIAYIIVTLSIIVNESSDILPSIDIKKMPSLIIFHERANVNFYNKYIETVQELNIKGLASIALSLDDFNQTVLQARVIIENEH